MGDLISRKALIEDIERSTFSRFIKEILEDFVDDQPPVEVPVKDKWIPVSERLPEEESLLYWTTHEDGSVVLHGYTKRNGFIYNWEVDDLEKRKRQGDVIAWTPIFQPEPYKGE